MIGRGLWETDTEDLKFQVTIVLRVIGVGVEVHKRSGKIRVPSYRTGGFSDERVLGEFTTD